MSNHFKPVGINLKSFDELPAPIRKDQLSPMAKVCAIAEAGVALKPKWGYDRTQVATKKGTMRCKTAVQVTSYLRNRKIKLVYLV